MMVIQPVKDIYWYTLLLVLNNVVKATTCLSRVAMMAIVKLTALFGCCSHCRRVPYTTPHDNTTVWVKKYPPPRFSGIFPKRLGILSFFTHLLYVPIYARLQILCNYLQLWRSYVILSATTQFTSYAQCPPSTETHMFRRLRKSLIALLIVVCGKSSQICCSAVFSAR